MIRRALGLVFLLVPAVARAEEPTTVTVSGTRESARKLQESADAVNVVGLQTARQQTSDLGEVLARTQGVTVRRDGGLGSGARFALNGLYDDQVRFFLDGVPLDLSGYPFGIANVPVNLVERVEVYRGVVPIRLGADALGGAVNLVSRSKIQNRLAASYQAGSWGTQRLTLDGAWRHEPSGLFVLGSAFLDAAKNNYPVDVQVPDARGRLQPATVRRFHDDYRAGGLTLEAGVVDRPWAKRLSVRGFVSSYDKDLQHNVVMTVPYGEVRSGETAYGATARWEVKPARDLELSLVGSWAHRRIDFVDASPWVYDWYGRRLRPRRVRGEIESSPTDQVVDQDALFARGLLAWTVHPQHVLRGSVTPQFTTRTGDERIEANSALRDPLTARRDLVTIVSGVEYEANLLGDRLSNVAFVKDYGYRARSEEPLPGGVFRQRRSTEHALGVGDAVRYRFTSWLLAKASYEFARRLPRPDEVFGNGVLVRANLGLEPEVSHNVNLGPRLDLRRTRIGDVMVDVNAFLRESDRLIVLLGSDTSYTHQNVYAARGVGLENAIAYATPGRVVTVDGTLTWQDVRNTSSEGTFGDTDGDRIPNRPWLFASWGARLRIPGLPDPVEPFYVGRYVHGFFRGWESKGLREFKQTVDAQVSHNLGVSWTVVRDAARVTSTFEVDNVTDERLYDNFGVQRPGRSFFVKLVGEI